MNYSKHYNTTATPQSQPIPGKKMKKNNAGGYSFEVSSEEQFKRFLILGSEGGTYYAKESNLTVENAKNSVDFIKHNGQRAVELILEVSTTGRAHKNDAAIFALALACSSENADTKQAAYSAVSKVCRTGTHLFTFMEQVKNLRGFSRGLRTAISKFYTTKTTDSLAYQLVKYKQRNGWSHKDVIKLAHPSGSTKEFNELMKYVLGREGAKPKSKLVLASEKAKTASTKELVKIIREYNLPREAIPTEQLGNVEVWKELLPNMPLMALVRNLGKMTSIGLLKPLSNETAMVVEKLTDAALIEESKMHPMHFLLALRTYEQGHGDKGSLSWNAVQTIVDALDEAFHLAFKNVTPTGKKILLALDYSGSMDHLISGTNVTAREAAVAMAYITKAVEPNVEVIAFTTELHRVSYPKKTSLQTLMRASKSITGGTDCSLPIKYADQHKLDVDAIIMYSDNESWAGQSHASQALKTYRNKSGNKQTKFVSVQMTATSFTNADPDDTMSLNVIGYDTSVPQVISEFIKE